MTGRLRPKSRRGRSDQIGIWAKPIYRAPKAIRTGRGTGAILSPIRVVYPIGARAVHDVYPEAERSTPGVQTRQEVAANI